MSPLKCKSVRAVGTKRPTAYFQIHVSSKYTRNSPFGGRRCALAAEVERCRSNGVAGVAVHVPAKHEAFLLPCQDPEVADESLTWRADPKVAKRRGFQHHVIGEDFQRLWELTALVRFKREGIRTSECCEKGGRIKSRLCWCCWRSAAPEQSDQCDDRANGPKAASHLAPPCGGVPVSIYLCVNCAVNATLSPGLCVWLSLVSSALGWPVTTRPRRAQ